MTVTRCNLCRVSLEGRPVYVMLCVTCEAKVPNIEDHLKALKAASAALARDRRLYPARVRPLRLLEPLWTAVRAYQADIAAVRQEKDTAS